VILILSVWGGIFLPIYLSSAELWTSSEAKQAQAYKELRLNPFIIHLNPAISNWPGALDKFTLVEVENAPKVSSSTALLLVERSEYVNMCYMKTDYLINPRFSIKTHQLQEKNGTWIVQDWIVQVQIRSEINT
jgi:hypothetical protein